jgi:hypothetical protein
LPPLAAMRARTVLWSHMFTFAESPMSSAGQPSSVASSLRAAKLLSISRSLSRSTMEVRQFSFCGFAAARCSSCATTSTSATGLGGGGATGARPGFAGEAVGGGTGVEAAAALPMPSFSRILPKNPMGASLGWVRDLPIHLAGRTRHAIHFVLHHPKRAVPLTSDGGRWGPIVGAKSAQNRPVALTPISLLGARGTGSE